MKTLLANLKENSIHLSLDNDDLKISFNHTDFPRELLEEIKRNKAELVTYLKTYVTKDPSIKYIPKIQSPQESYTVSSSQLRLWLLSQFEGGNTAYNIPGVFVFEGNLNREALEKAFMTLINRHEILRTVFNEDAQGDVKQYIRSIDEIGFKLEYLDLRNARNQAYELKELVQQEFFTVFNLASGPLLKAKLYHTEDNKWVFSYVMHHIISDGWSMGIMIKELLSLYNIYIKGLSDSLPPLRIQYKDFAAWQQDQLTGKKLQAHKAYWIRQFEGALPVLDFPSEAIRPTIKTYNGGVIATRINGTLSDKIKKLCKDQDATLFMGLLSLVKVVLYRYTGQNDLIVGSPIAGREHPDLEDQIGFYVNTLALRTTFNGSDSFLKLLDNIKMVTLGAYEHQVYPFDELVEELNLERDVSRNPLFDVVVALQGAEISPEELVHPDGITVSKYKEAKNLTSKFDLLFTFVDLKDELYLSINYNRDIYNKESITRLASHTVSILQAIVQYPDQALNRLDYLSKTEKKLLLEDFNDTTTPYPYDKTLVDLFEEQVERAPDNIAVLFQEEQLTYRELNERSNQLAHHLRDRFGIGSEDFVGIQLERSEWVIISILGILKAGGTYVPIDPEYPDARKQYIIEDTSLKLLITQDDFVADINYYHGAVFAIDVDFEASNYSVSSTDVNVTSDNLAYVIYTSGSTGTPKGVMVEQKSVVRLVKDTNIYSFSSSDKLLSTGAISFDATTFEYWGPLLNGGQLVICTQKILLDNALLQEEIKSNSINIMWFTAGWLNQLIESEIKIFSGLKTILAGGDKLSPSHIEKLRRNYPELKIINGYGPTENTTFSITHDILEVTGDIPIGKPISNTQVYLLNEEQQLQPTRVMGEIYLGGDGLARGYLNQEALTKEKFIANPFKEGERLYKTGDLGRWTNDGNIEFIGRKDDQVKIRGYRIELGEIEHVLLKNEQIDEAVVLARENQSKEKELVAYIIAKEEQNTSELRSYLKETLPDYMLPAYYVQLEALPLTPNGKVDRKALPDPQGLGLTSGVAYVAPGNEIEEKLVKIWEEVLKRKQIGVKDDFFALGGHSLKAVRLSNEYQKELAIKLPLKDLFAHTSISSHAELIRSSKRLEFIQIEKVAHQECYPISDAQRRLWVLSQFEESSIAYNIPASIDLNQDVDIDHFKKAINATIDRHEILRTVFKEDASGEIKQWVLNREDSGFKINYKDYRKDQNKAEKIKEYIGADSYKPFDLEKGPLLRASLLQVADERYVFYFNMHHIISDGWSMDVLSKDVFSYYGAIKENGKEKPKELRIQYKDYSVWALDQIKKESFIAHRTYWLDNLNGELPLLDLPVAKQRPGIKTSNGRGLSAYMDGVTSSKLKNYSEANGGSLFMGLLAAWKILMYQYTSQKDIIIGTPMAGREHSDLEDQIGFYVNTLALRNEIKPEESFDIFYRRLKDNTLRSYSHQMYPFDRLVEELDLQRNTSRSAIFDIMLILQNNGDKTERIDSIATGFKKEKLDEITDLGHCTSKFDVCITFREIGNYLSLYVVYNPDVYEGAMIEGLIRHYKQLINVLLENPQEKISQIDYLSQEDKNKLLITFNNTAVAYPKDKTIVDLFEEQAAKTPDSIAVVFEEKELTYRALNENANQLAHYLLDLNQLSKGDFINVTIHRSEYLIITLLGILKSGFAYVLLDPSLPEERLNFILNDSGSNLLINDEFIYNVQNQASSLSKEKPAVSIQPDDVVYLMYTSGSTGNPKGAINIYRGFTNTVRWYAEEIGITEQDRVGIISNLSFDLTQKNYFAPLIVGARVYVDSEFNPANTGQFIRKHKISIINCAPTLFYSLLDENQACLISLKKVILGGESINFSSIKHFLESNDVAIYNSYGPSEASDVSIYHQLTKDQTKIIPIGKPIWNTTAFLLNSALKLVPAGVSGEICVGGIGLGLGYLNQNELTAQKFVDTKEWGRLYRTGDIGRYNSRGEIEFIGRVDNQVKIRGHRIELEEIETKIQYFEEIIKQVCVEVKTIDNEQVLVAYLVVHPSFDKSALRKELQKKLPAYMIPAYFVELSKLPLTSNGKIDRKSLPDAQTFGRLTKAEYVAPRNATEEKLITIWEKVLQRDNIGIQDDFFVLGGHSLKAVRLSNEYQKELGIKISLKDLFTYNILEDQAKLIDNSTKSDHSIIKVIENQDSYPLSSSQRRMWILNQFEDGSLAYNMSVAYVFEGELDKALLNRSFRDLIKRHEILRTVFKEDETGEVRQWIKSEEEVFSIAFEDGRLSDNKKMRASQFVREDGEQAFDLSTGPLLRAGLLQLEEKKWIFTCSMHHIISDGWSMRIMVNELMFLYNSYANGTPHSFTPLTIQYKDYAVWQQAQLSGETIEQHRQYWLGQFSGTLPVLEIPGDRLRPALKTYNGGVVSCRINSLVSKEIKKLCQTHGSTLFMGLLGVVKTVLYKYSHQTDFIIGSPAAGREHFDLEDQIGFYVNTLALRTQFKGEDNFTELLGKVKEATLGAYEHQVYPFDELVEELHLERDMSRNALFDVMVTFQSAESPESGKVLSPETLRIKRYIEKDSVHQKSKFDLSFDFTEVGEEIQASVEYNNDIYDKETVERMLVHFEQLLNAVTQDPNLPIHQLDYLSSSEKEQLLFSFNDTSVTFPEKTVIDLLEEQVIAHPDATAILCGENVITYEEFNGASNQFGAYLKSNYNIKPDDLIGIKLERSEWMFIVMFGILKSGGAYVPIDSEYPADRINYMIADSGCKVVIGNEELLKFKKLSKEYSAKNLNTRIKKSELAYVMYTSGSTGTPKGVMIEHRSLVDYALTFKTKFNINEADRVIQQSSISFDTHVEECYPTLVSGAKLLISENGGRDIEELQTLIAEQNATVLSTTPFVLNELNKMNAASCQLRLVISGGDKFSSSDVTNYLGKVPVFDSYGPTETTVARIFTEIGSSMSQGTIGSPISNTQVYILGSAQELVAIGVTGEICIGGSGLARGYLNQQELSAEKFITNPFQKEERIYKTGDLGRWRSDGTIEFIGRKDNQMKIRGYRIEPGEIETTLQQYPGVLSAVVAIAGSGKEKMLVAYLVSKDELEPTSIRIALSKQLPAYMIPTHFIQLDELPLTANGKINRKVLEAAEIKKATVEYIAPRNETEHKLVEIWSDILAVEKEKISINDNFFELGGNSIKIIKLAKMITKVFGQHVGIPVLFQYANIKSFIDYIEDKQVVKQEENFDRDEFMNDLSKFNID